VILFASDLDQTLIYSHRHIEEKEESFPIRPVEILNEKIISYMTERAIENLRGLMEKIIFIPVTTRTISQYQRVSIFSQELQPKYAVTSNGGNILVGGNVDETWNRSIHKKISDTSLSKEEVMIEFEKLAHDSWFKKKFMADDLFYYCIIDREKLPLDEIYEFGKWLSSNGWDLSLQGRKIYLIPSVVNKRDAILHIKERENGQLLISSGDSLLDMSLLLASDHALIPAHGEVYSLQKNQGISFTKTNGIVAAEEILQYVEKIITKVI
jgi:hydroxymethylpyrimidine pyrophosphatase-like HAD family hydrolase